MTLEFDDGSDVEYCSGECFRCPRSGNCEDEELVDQEDNGEAWAPLPFGDLPSCQHCGRLDCDGECQMLEPDPEEDPPLERDDIGEPEDEDVPF